MIRKQSPKRISLPKQLEKTQKVFNAWIRNRDKDKGCISCKTGAVENCGHYFSQGHHSSLRFNEMNCNGQCIKCNKWEHGNLINYRHGLVARYGLAKVEMLENTPDLRKVKKWSEFELLAIQEMYSLKLNKAA